MKTIYSLAFSLSLIACGSEQKFNAGVPTAAAQKPGTLDAEPVIEKEIDELPEVIAPPPPSPPPPMSTPEKPKPDTTETFNECKKFGNANIVADLYPSTEPKFYEMGQKPLTTLVYGSPTKTFCMTNLDIPMRNFSEGFPGYPDLKSWFILDIKFRIDAPAAGDYEILIDSDDGAIITINEADLINVDGLRNGNLKVYERKTVSLKKGMNKVRVRYFQGPGPDLALQLKWVVPGQTTPAVIPAQFIKLPE